MKALNGQFSLWKIRNERDLHILGFIYFFLRHLLYNLATFILRALLGVTTYFYSQLLVKNSAYTSVYMLVQQMQSLM
jgi:hypothetical protein